MDNFISTLRKKKSDYNNPDQATTQEQSLIQLSSGIYTEEERFVFELLQNAVDAFDEANEYLDIKIIIKDGYLVLMHNGEAFSKRDIEGLCDVGNGNKMKDAKKIGYKGIGFKSVFWSKCVTIDSGGYCFKFDKDYWDGYWEKNWKPEYGEKDPDKQYLMPWQIIPLETTPPEIDIDTSAYNVAIYILLGRKKNIGEKVVRLMSDSQFLLFVKTRNIKMSYFQNGKLSASLEKRTLNDTVQLFKNGKEDSRWLIHTNESVKVPTDMLEEIREDGLTPIKLQDAKSFELSFAIKIDKDNHLEALDDAVVYTYLPTSFKFGDTGLPFLVNANFITDAGRQQLHKDSAWNKLIFSRVPFEFLTWMSQISDKYANYYEVLPKKDYGDSNTLEMAYEESMDKAIEEIAFIPSLHDSSRKLKACEALMDCMGIAETVSEDVLVRHINKTYGKSFDSNSFIKQIWRGNDILKKYGVFFFDKSRLEKLFENGDCFSGIDAGLDKKLIEFLYRYWQQADKSGFAETLKSVKFLLDENNNLSVPTKLFFPSDYREQNDLAGDVTFLNSDIAEYVNENSDIKNWLEDVGVSELNDISFIKDVLCKEGYVTKDNAIAVGQFLFEANQHQNIFDAVGDYSLSAIIFLSKRGTLKSACELYLGSFYKPDVDLEKAYSGDIYVSDDYVDDNNVDEWKVFLQKFGVNESIKIKLQKLKFHSDWNIIKKATQEFEKKKNLGWPYHYQYSSVSYPPIILDLGYVDHDLFKIIWTKIFNSKLEFNNDFAEGFSGLYTGFHQKCSFENLGIEPFLEWAIKNWQKFPATDGSMLLSKDLYANTENIRSVGGKYLPIIDVDCEIDNSWDSLLNLKTQVGLDDLLRVLSRIAADTEKVEDNKSLITNIYNRIIEIGGLENSGNKDRIRSWAEANEIFSLDGKFYAPSDLRYVTIDGFGNNGRVYIGNVSNRDKAIELMGLFGVKIITDKSIKPEFKGKEETVTIKNSLTTRLSALALLKIGDNNHDKEEYKKAKNVLRSKVANTHFYKCDKILLSYGNSDDVVERTTVGLDDNFYFIGVLRPANLEPLMEPLCSFLGLNKKCASELFVLMIENLDGIKSYLKDKGYDTDLMAEDINTSITETKVFSPILDSGITPNAHTGFKGEVYMYNYLKSQGYEPICPSIVTENDVYDFSIEFQNKVYYHKNNYDRYDITFMSKNGVKVYLEVKTTVLPTGATENMPISHREYSMIDEVNDSDTEAFIIARIFSINDNPSVYFFRGHKL